MFWETSKEEGPQHYPLRGAWSFFITSSDTEIYEGFYAEGTENTFLERVIKNVPHRSTE